MRWWVPGLLALASACTRTPSPSPQPSVQVRTPAPAPAVSAWPDVTAPVSYESGSSTPLDNLPQRDGAIVVAIEHYPDLPAVPGAFNAGADWFRFLRESLMVARLASLVDAQATKAAILTAVENESWHVNPDSKFWIVFVGHGGGDLVPVDGGDGRDPKRRLAVSALFDAAARGRGRPIVVLETGFDRDVTARFGARVDRKATGPFTSRSPVVIDGGGAGLLPGTSRPMFSYFFLGALRGWGDANGDGAVTATEAFDFARDAVRVTRRDDSALLEFDSAFDCRSLTTLSTLQERVPDQIAQKLSRALAAPEPSPVPEPDPVRRPEADRAARHYKTAASATDGDVALCEWEETANAYGALARADFTRNDEPEAVINGAYAYRQIHRDEEAADLYEAYLRAQSRGIRGDDKKVAKERHKYTALACNQFFELAKEAPRLLPEYGDLCFDQPWLDCSEGDVADCAGTCPAGGKACAQWAEHAELGAFVLRDIGGARRVWKSICAGGDQRSCERLGLVEGEPSREKELERLKQSAREFERDAVGLDELSTWESGTDAQSLERQALDRARAAESAFRAVVEQRAIDPDAIGSLLSLARVRVLSIALTVRTGVVPEERDAKRTKETVLAALDVTIGDRRKTAARLSIDLADRLLEAEEAEFERSHGARGVPHRREIRFEGEGTERRVVKEPIPEAVSRTLLYREGYIGFVAPANDLEHSRAEAALEMAGTYFVYGHLTEARGRAEWTYWRECGRSLWGYEAWERLVAIAIRQNDAKAVEKLARARSCAIDPETRFREKWMLEPRLQSLFATGCTSDLQAAARLPRGPERDAMLRQAAICFADFVEGAAAHLAPEAARHAAEAYEAVGDRARAIHLYETYLDRAGSEKALHDLEKGLRDRTPPIVPDEKRYAERLLSTGSAYDALVSLYEATHDYRRAALALVAESAEQRLPHERRLAAARRAVVIAGARGATGMLKGLRKTLIELRASEADRSRAGALLRQAEAAASRFTPTP